MSELTDRVTRAIAWYEANREVLASAMPLTHQGITWRRLSLEDLDRLIVSYREGQQPPQITRVYLLNRIRKLYRALEQKKKEG